MRHVSLGGIAFFLFDWLILHLLRLINLDAEILFNSVNVQSIMPLRDLWHGNTPVLTRLRISLYVRPVRLAASMVSMY